MSRAFIKEDVDPPERPRRARGSSGLPPGAANYITARGAQRLRAKLLELQKQPGPNRARIAELDEVLASVTVVQVPEDRNQIVFGARVTVRDAVGQLRFYEIVGVDELDLHAHAVSWISATGKALLSAEVGYRVVLPAGERVELVTVEYPDE